MYQELIDLIEQSRVSFPKFGNGMSPTAVADAEKAIGLALPESYKWWLLNYGGGQIGGDLVYGVDEGGIGLPDIVELARMNERNGFHGVERLVFYMGNEESYFFETSSIDENGEYKVFWFDAENNHCHFYSDTFAEFLMKRIQEVYHV